MIDLLDEPQPSVTFHKVNSKKIPLEYGPGGHLMIHIGQQPGLLSQSPPTLSGPGIEVFHQQSCERNFSDQKVLRSKMRKKIQKMADEAKEQGKAIWKELRRGCKLGKVRLIKELYSGVDGGIVTNEAREHGHNFGRPRDLLLGDNLLNMSEQEAILNEIRQEKPALVTIGFPCGPWSSLSNFKEEELRREDQEVKFEHLEFIRKVCEIQIEGGRHFLLENPLASQAWKHIMQWMQLLPHFTCRMDQCTTGLKDWNGDFVLKPTRFITSSPVLAAALSRRCDGEHSHAEVQGRGQGVSASLAQWTKTLGNIIVNAMISQLTLEVDSGAPKYHLEEADVYHGALRRSADAVFREPIDLDAEPEQDEWEQFPLLLRSAIVKVHKQYSHSVYKDTLVRHLRLGGASEQAIKAASLFTCPTCEKERRNPPRPVAAHPRYDHFNECVACDIAHIPDLNGRQHSFLFMVDTFTHYTITAYLCSSEEVGRPSRPQVSHARKALLDWCEIFGSPEKMQLDQDSSFRGDFRTVLDQFGIEEVLVARDAHWSHGIVERKIETVKEMMCKVVHDSELNIASPTMTRMAVSNCAHTLNRLSNNKGFSPAQCVLGAQPHLPENLTGSRETLDIADPAGHISMQYRLKLLQDCEEAFVKANHSATLRRALLAQTRSQPGPFELHSMVMYKRKPLKRKVYQQWQGPARVIGKDIHGYWLIHRGVPVLAHPNNLRRAIAEEDLVLIEGDDGPDRRHEQQGYLDLSQPIDNDPIVLREEGDELHEERLSDRLAIEDPNSPDVIVEGEAARVPILEDEDYEPEPLNEEEAAELQRRRNATVVVDLEEPETGEIEEREESEGHESVEDEEEKRGVKRSEKPPQKLKQERPTKSQRRRRRRKRREESAHDDESEKEGAGGATSSHQHNVDEQPETSEEHESHKRKRESLLDDVPISIRSVLARKDGEGEGGGASSSAHPEEVNPFLASTFLAERCDAYVKNNKHTELRHNKMQEDLPGFDSKVIAKAMQTAVSKEIGTWLKFDAVEVIPPKQAAEVREKNPEKIISSRGVWTRKPKESPQDLELKCRIVGRGFQEQYDESLRRDSPTCSNLLVSIICSIAASCGMKLTAADVRGAFLQGLKIDRKLYFDLPKNLGSATLPDIEAGSLLRLKKSIYGVNDAARQWYHSIKKVLLQLGWTSLTFEPAGFALRDEGSQKIIALLALHVDDVLICWNETEFPQSVNKCNSKWRKLLNGAVGVIVSSNFAVVAISRMKIPPFISLRKTMLKRWQTTRLAARGQRTKRPSWMQLRSMLSEDYLDNSSGTVESLAMTWVSALARWQVNWRSQRLVVSLKPRKW